MREASARLPQSRARIATELYARAYWRYYLTAGSWVLFSQAFWRIVTGQG